MLSRDDAKGRRGALQAFRRALVASADGLAAEVTASLPWRASEAETLSSEVLPLAEACRFLERESAKVLAPRRVGRRGRPLWLAGVRSVVHRDPWGRVLVLMPHNYPLMLGGVPMLQALAAGNTVALKPGERGAVAAGWLQRLCDGTGFAERVTVLDESVEAGERAMDAGVDHVVLTGSAATGRAVLRRCAETLTPVTCELSGCDAMVVLASADVGRVVGALRFAMRLNESRTCIAPRAVFVHEPLHERLTAELRDAGLEPERADPLDADRFEPVFTLTPFSSVNDTIERINARRYALGCSVFGEPGAAARVAGRLDVGVVTVNDVVMPTADSRLPFGGRRGSGFGVTRGAEGLLAMTRPRVVIENRSRLRPHYDAETGADAALFAQYLDFAHGPRRAAALPGLVRAAMAQRRAARKPAAEPADHDQESTP